MTFWTQTEKKGGENKAPDFKLIHLWDLKTHGTTTAHFLWLLLPPGSAGTEQGRGSEGREGRRQYSQSQNHLSCLSQGDVASFGSIIIKCMQIRLGCFTLEKCSSTLGWGVYSGNISFWKKKMGCIPTWSKHFTYGASKHFKDAGPLPESSFLAMSQILMELFLMDLSPAACINPEALVA